MERKESRWSLAADVDILREENARATVRVDGKHIALFATPDGILACNNRCPHEGYPLSEGTLDRDCWLTCHWHNWKFNLKDGANLYGGDRLRVYPVDVRDGKVWVDTADEPAADKRVRIRRDLHTAMEDNDYFRIARELGRLADIDGDAALAVADAIEWSSERFEFGWTHAYAGAADWLALHDERQGQDAKLSCVLEAVGHIADDALRQPRYAFDSGSEPYDEDAFVAAVEDEDVARASRIARGGLQAGGFDALDRGLVRAALSHYSGFGHSLIYVDKASSLCRRLGAAASEGIVLALVRALSYARREDQIPEFADYAKALGAWPSAGSAPTVDPTPQDFRRVGIGAALERALSFRGADPERLHSALLGASAWNMLAFDLERATRTSGPISGNVSWLDFTHALTFGAAVRASCERHPREWPRGLLQMACFVGRNRAFTVAEPDLDHWHVEDIDGYMDSAVERLFDHGDPEFITSVHLLKTTLAVREELARGLPEEVAALCVAALRRFLETPLKRKHLRRTVSQALSFVAREDGPATV